MEKECGAQDATATWGRAWAGSGRDTPAPDCDSTQGAQKVRRPYTLAVIDGVSRDTIECLSALLEAAKRGEVIGVCYAAMHKKRQYTVHACGEAHRNPTFSSGMVSALWFDLQRQARGEA